MQESYLVNRGQAPPPPNSFHAQHRGALSGRPPPPPVVVQQRPRPPQMPPQMPAQMQRPRPPQMPPHMPPQMPAQMQRPMPPQIPPQMPPQMQRSIPPPAGAFPPHPPREIIPPQLQRSVVVSDIRPEVQTEEDIREHLTNFIIFKFEKVEPYDEYDSDGGKVKATWDNCIRRRLPDVDKADARREIRRLNKEDAKKGRTWLEKQNSMGPKAQNQLAKAQRDLSSEEQDDRFHTVLAQINSSLKPVVEKHEKVTRHRSNTKRKIRRRTRYERVSITAYFKRCPKENQVPSELARQIELDKQRLRQRQERQQLEMMRQGQHQMQEPQMPPQQPQVMPHAHSGPMPNPQVGQMNRPGPPPPPQHHQQKQQVAHMNRPQALPMQQHNKAYGSSRPHTPILVHEPSRRDRHHKKGQSRSSGSSEYSDPRSGSEFGSDTTLFTEPSRSSGSYKGKKDYGRKRRPLRYLENPKSFGVEVHPARRHGLGEEHSYILTGSGPRSTIFQVPALPREATIPVENLEQLRADAYHAGRSDQKAVEYKQRLAEVSRLDTAARRYQPRYAPRPEVVLDRGSPRIHRHVTPSEVDRQLDDSFQRLRLGRESRHHDEFDGLLHRDERRHRESAALEEQEHIFEKFEEREARNWRRHGSPPPMLNPFAPLSRRRTGVAYGFERDYRR